MQKKTCDVEKVKETVIVSMIAQGVVVFDEYMFGTKVFPTAL